MSSKFNDLFKQSYIRLFEEEFPPKDFPEEEDELNSPENVVKPKNVPNPMEDEEQDFGDDFAPVDLPEDNGSQLPDPKESETVTINLLNTFIDFMNLPENTKQEFLRSYTSPTARANSENYKTMLDVLKSITNEKLPEQII